MLLEVGSPHITTAGLEDCVRFFEVYLELTKLFTQETSNPLFLKRSVQMVALPGPSPVWSLGLGDSGLVQLSGSVLSLRVI